LIIPEASHPVYGTLHHSAARTVRTTNPFKRLALLAMLHRFNQDPARWIQVFSDAGTEAGRAVISALFDDLPNVISDALLKESETNTTLTR
jgi:hypothetical protein